MFLFTDFIILLATFLVCTILIKALRRKAESRRYPPSIPSLPLVGSLPFICKFDNIHEYFRSKADQLGPIFTFRAGRRLCLTLNSKDTIEEALVNNSVCFAGRASYYIERITNKNRKGIIGKDFTDDFKSYHKLSLSVLKEFGFGMKPLMETRISEEFEAMETFIRAKEGKEFNPNEMTRLGTYNVIKNILFGKREDYENGLDEILTLFRSFLLNFITAIDVAPALLQLLPYFSQKVELCVKSMSGICEILEADIENIKRTGTVDCFVSSYLAKVGPDYDHEQLIYTTRDLIGAGSDSTATTLLWLLVFVVNNPATQERLQKEIDDVIPRQRLPSLDDQPKLPFVEAVILEVMRLRTVIPLSVPHLTLSDSKVCGYFIPAETKVFPNLHAAHMDPNVWRDPDVFRPERFLDKDNNIIGRDRVVSFSLGRRSCLGEILARQVHFLFFAGWMQRFNIQLGEDEQKIDDTPVVEVSMTSRFSDSYNPDDSARSLKKCLTYKPDFTLFKFL